MKRNMLKKIIRLPYYYVPPCPSCKSDMTGYFIKKHSSLPSGWEHREALRNGELAVTVSEVPKENAFCFECDYKWKQAIEMKLFTLEQIEEERKKRNTQMILDSELSEMEPEHEGKFISFRRFIGKL